MAVSREDAERLKDYLAAPPHRIKFRTPDKENQQWLLDHDHRGWHFYQFLVTWGYDTDEAKNNAITRFVNRITRMTEALDYEGYLYECDHMLQPKAGMLQAKVRLLGTVQEARDEWIERELNAKGRD